MATTRRETEYVIRAVDDSKGVASAVANVKKLESQLESAKAAAAAASAKQTEFNESLKAGDAITAAQAKKIEALSKAEESANARVAGLAKAVESQTEALLAHGRALEYSIAFNKLMDQQDEEARSVARVTALLDKQAAEKLRLAQANEATIAAKRKEIAAERELFNAERDRTRAAIAAKDQDRKRREYVELWTQLIPKADEANTKAARNMQRFGFLGLRSYDLQNLGYQINDIATQLGSGTPISQVFAQQGGQILQLIPGAMGKLVEYLPRILAIGAAVFVVYEGMERIFSLERSNREFGAQLAVNADGARFSAQALTDMARAAEHAGVSFEDARGAIKAFIGAGLGEQSGFPLLIKLAQDFSNYSGKAVPEAAQAIGEAFTKGYAGVKSFDDALNFLTVDQRENIRVLYDQGRAQEAQSIALAAFAAKMAGFTQDSKTEWSVAIHELGESWRSLLDVLNDTGVISVAIGALRLLAETARDVVQAVDTLARSNPLNVVNNAMGAYIRWREGASGAGTAPPVDAPNFNMAPSGVIGSSPESDKQQKAGRDYIAILREQLAATEDLTGAERIRKAGLEAVREIEARGVTDQGLINEARSLAEAKERVAVNKQLASQAKSAASAAEAEARAIEAKKKAIFSALSSSLTAAGNTDGGSLEQRIQGITEKYDILYKKIAEARSRGIGDVNGQSLGAIESQLRANEELVKQDERKTFAKEKLAAAERELNEIIRARNDQAKIYQEQVDQRILSEDEANTKTMALYEQTQPLIDAQIQKVRDLATSYYGMGWIAEAAFNMVVSKLDLTAAKSKVVDETLNKTRDTLNQMVVAGGVKFFEDISTAIGQALDKTISWSEALQDVGRAFLSFAADFLRQIANMILQQAILNALTGKSGSDGSTAGDIAAWVISLFHKGGIVGQGTGQSKKVSPAVFANAPRMHSGGIVGGGGLAADERAIIGKVGEEMLTADDPRHSRNGGGGGTTVLNLIDPADMLQKALSLPRGQKALINYMRNNKQALGGATG